MRNLVHETEKIDKIKRQSDEYAFPYHHIPYEDKNGIKSFRQLRWGYEYLAYIKHTKKIIETLNPASLCDVGCGDGKLLSILSRKIDLMGVDLDNRATLFAQAFNPDIKILCDDISNVHKQFDCVTAIEVIEHIPDCNMELFMKALFCLIKPNGYLVISVPTNIIPCNKKHFRHYEYETLKNDLLKSGTSFSVEETTYFWRETRLYKIWLRFLSNKHWYIHINCLAKYFEKYCSKKCEQATVKSGKHLILVIKKN